MRELLIEIGCEELPARWLPPLTAELAERLDAHLRAARVERGSPVLSFSTPRRLMATVAELADRQADLEETVTGPPVSAAYDRQGAPTPAAIGFARKHGVDVAVLAQVDTRKGRYLAYHRRQRGRPTIDALPAVLAGTLRELTFPRLMRWDAWLDDGRGELPFGRPIRWIVFLFGGQVVPFVIKRTIAAAGDEVQDVSASKASTGHRFLGGDDRAGLPFAVRSSDEYRRQLADHFVVLDRAARRDTIVRELDACACAVGGSVDLATPSQVALLEEVPDLVEYPVVISGSFAGEFLTLPDEVLTTTMIHHQHFFPVIDRQGRLKPVFLAVANTTPANADTVSQNAGRVLAARLRDARFFWEADRRTPLESRLARLETVLFHKALGSYRAKTERLVHLAGWIAREVFQASDDAAAAETAARLAKVDLATEMVGEFPELQGIMGGIYAREESRPEQVWKAIYHHYLPVGVDAGAPPSREALGTAAVSWAALALADRLDTLVGLFGAGERPTGSRDPFGLRRQAQGICKILIDLPVVTGLRARPTVRTLIDAAQRPFAGDRSGATDDGAFQAFMRERLRYVLEQRGFDVRNVRAVTWAPADAVRPREALQKLEVLPEFTDSPDFKQLATAFKRVRNIARELSDQEFDRVTHIEPELGDRLTADAERCLLRELNTRAPIIDEVITSGVDYRRGFAEAAGFGPAVDRFFTEVFVMVDDRALRTARLRLMKRLERVILQLADMSEMVPETDA